VRVMDEYIGFYCNLYSIFVWSDEYGRYFDSRFWYAFDSFSYIYDKQGDGIDVLSEYHNHWENTREPTPISPNADYLIALDGVDSYRWR
jgi:hypothetical protein